MLSRRIFPLLLCVASLALGATVPRPAPDFAVDLTDGSQIHLSQYRGKVVVMAFILTTCPHCQFTSRILTKLQQEYGPQGFQVVVSAIEGMAKMNVPDFIRNFKPAYPVGYTQREVAESYLEHPVMFRMMMPQVVVIDRKGTIRAQYAGDDSFIANEADQEKNFRGLLEPLLGEEAARRKK